MLDASSCMLKFNFATCDVIFWLFWFVLVCGAYYADEADSKINLSDLWSIYVSTTQIGVSEGGKG